MVPTHHKLTERELVEHILMLRTWARMFPVGDYARQIDLLADAYQNDLRVLAQNQYQSTMDFIRGI